ncbi:MAG: YggT family protein [Proteobacteria bacterium]|nr:YggT family protein [Pseudomonadota bacterium]MBU4037905.1 YggT family protein [Pseudomonadota bacterium]
MFILGNFIDAAAVVIGYVLKLYMWIIIARAILSWVNPDPYNTIVRFIHNVTEPVLYPIRSKIPYLGGIDLAPIIVILIIVFLDNFLVRSLHKLAFMLS